MHRWSEINLRLYLKNSRARSLSDSVRTQSQRKKHHGRLYDAIEQKIKAATLAVTRTPTFTSLASPGGRGVLVASGSLMVLFYPTVLWLGFYAPT